MKKLVVALLMLVAVTSVAGAQSWIGMFDNDSGQPICDADIALGEPVSVYIIAVIQSGDFEYGITAAEFRVDNLPLNGYEFGGIISATWTSDVTVGDLGWDFSIAWPTPQPGPFVLIGQLDFLMLDSVWIGVDHAMEIEQGNICECLVLVDDLFVVYDVIGGMFTWNCSGECLCIWVNPTQDSSWGAVKALF